MATEEEKDTKTTVEEEESLEIGGSSHKVVQCKYCGKSMQLRVLELHQELCDQKK